MAKIRDYTMSGTTYTFQGDGAVQYDGAQTLTDAQKAQAQQNIGAASEVVEQELLASSGYSADLLTSTTWTNGYYVNASGVVTSSTASRMSDYIAVEGGSVAFMVTEHVTANNQLIVSSISAYTSSKTFIERSGSTSHRAGTAYTRVVLPSNAAYVIISTGITTYLTRTNFYTEAAVSANTVRYDIAQSLTDAQKAQARQNIGVDDNSNITAVERELLTGDGYGNDLLTNTTWTNGYYVNSIGVVASSAASRMSDYIAVGTNNIGFMVTVHVTGNDTYITSSISAYDSEKEFIARLGTTAHRAGTASTRVTLPAKTAYIIISTGITTYMSRTSFYLEKRDVWWESRKWYAIGDSITYGTYSVSGGTYSRNPAIAHPVVCASLLGYNLTNYGVPGMGFVQVSTVAPGTDSSLTDVLNNHTYDGAELVTVMLGTNDYGHSALLGTIADTSATASVYGRIKLIVETMQTKCPAARLIFLTPIPRATSGSAATQYCKHAANSAGYTLDDVKDAIITSCEYYGIEYLNLQDTGPLNYANKATYLYDNLHPSIAGHELLGRWLAREITF